MSSTLSGPFSISPMPSSHYISIVSCRSHNGPLIFLRERLQNLLLRLSFLPSGLHAIHPSPSPLPSHAPGPSVCESVFQSRGESGSLSATSSLTFLPSSPPPPTLFFPSLSLFSSLAHLLTVSCWPLPSPLLLFLTLQLFFPDLFSPLSFSISW